MERIGQYISRLPVGWTCLTLLLSMAVVQLSWPGEVLDRLPGDVLGPTSLAMDRLQLRLTNEMLEKAVAARSAESGAYRIVAGRMDSLERYLPVQAAEVRLWAADRLFNPQQSAGRATVRDLVLVYERRAGESDEPGDALFDDDDENASTDSGADYAGAARGPTATTAVESRRVGVADEFYGRAWSAMETLVRSEADADGRNWLVRATAPIIDSRGRVAGLAEVGFETPRAQPWPQWPRWAMLITLLGVMALLVELRDATFRRLLHRLGIPISLWVLRYEPPANAAEIALAGRISSLATRAENSNRHWLLRPPTPQRKNVDAGSVSSSYGPTPNIRLPLQKSESTSVPAAAQGGISGDDTAAGDEPHELPARGAEQRILASATIEDERLLASVLEMLLPHVDSGGETPAAPAGAEFSADKVSLRVTIEIYNRVGVNPSEKTHASTPRQTREL